MPAPVPSSSAPSPRQPDRAARIVGRPIFWLVAIALLFGVPLVRALLRKLPPELPVLGEIPAFSTTLAAGPKAGQAFDTPAELPGRVWIGAFVDPTDKECAGYADALAAFQKRARNLGDSWRLVTFVPPGAAEHGLAAFAADRHPNWLRWHFLVMPAEVETVVIHALYQTGTMAPVGPTVPGQAHKKHLAFVVDRRGRVRGFYDVLTAAGLDAALADVGILANL